MKFSIPSSTSSFNSFEQNENHANGTSGNPETAGQNLFDILKDGVIGLLNSMSTVTAAISVAIDPLKGFCDWCRTSNAESHAKTQAASGTMEQENAALRKADQAAQQNADRQGTKERGNAAKAGPARLLSAHEGLYGDLRDQVVVKKRAEESVPNAGKIDSPAEFTPLKEENFREQTRQRWDFDNRQDMPLNEETTKMNALTVRGGFASGTALPNIERISRNILKAQQTAVELLKQLQVNTKNQGMF